MQIKKGGWKKLYLFYGIIFFSLGLLGFLFNSRVSLSQLAQGALVGVARELAGLGLIPSGTTQEVSVSHSGLVPVVFICPTGTGDPRYEILREQILAKIEEKNPVIEYSASMPQWYRLPQIRSFLSKGQFLVGLTLDTNQSSYKAPAIIFSISKPMTIQFLNQITNLQTDFPLFKLELIARGQNYLYGFSFDEPSLSARHLLKVIDILLDLWKTEGPNGRWGNYLETFW